MYIGSLPIASNRATYEVAFSVLDDDTGSGFDLSGFTVSVSVRDPVSKDELLTATNDAGVDMTFEDDGMFTVTFTPTQMRTLCAKQYDVGITIADDSDADSVTQLFIGVIPVLSGVVS